MGCCDPDFRALCGLSASIQSRWPKQHNHTWFSLTRRMSTEHIDLPLAADFRQNSPPLPQSACYVYQNPCCYVKQQGLYCMGLTLSLCMYISDLILLQLQDHNNLWMHLEKKTDSHARYWLAIASQSWFGKFLDSGSGMCQWHWLDRCTVLFHSTRSSVTLV